MNFDTLVDLVVAYGDAAYRQGKAYQRLLDSNKSDEFQKAQQAAETATWQAWSAIENELKALRFSPAERAYLVRSIDLGRSDDEARGHLSPTQRDDLQNRLGGRPS